MPGQPFTIGFLHQYPEVGVQPQLTAASANRLSEIDPDRVGLDPRVQEQIDNMLVGSEGRFHSDCAGRPSE